jgi:DNA-binding MarR family transcriptional regulator
MEDGLVDALVQTSFATMAVLTRLGAEHDLSLTQLRVLAILRDRRVRMTELAGYLGLDKSTMTGLVGRAERRGLLQRARSAGDGRAIDVAISPAGAALVDELRAGITRELAPLAGGLSRPDQRRLQVLLEHLLTPRPSGAGRGVGTAT